MTIQETIADLNKRDQERYAKLAAKNYASEIYERTTNKIVAPGYYEVIETDHGGTYDTAQFTIEITKPINMKNLAIKLYESLDYVSPWIYLSIREKRVDYKISI